MKKLFLACITSAIYSSCSAQVPRWETPAEMVKEQEANPDTVCTHMVICNGDVELSKFIDELSYQKLKTFKKVRASIVMHDVNDCKGKKESCRITYVVTLHMSEKR